MPVSNTMWKLELYCASWIFFSAFLNESQSPLAIPLVIFSFSDEIASPLSPIIRKEPLLYQMSSNGE